MFSWIPIHQEAARKILEFPEPQKELLSTLREMERQGLKVIRLKDENPKGSSRPLEQIDPFTFFATFNRGLTKKNRCANWQFVKTRWSLRSEIPQDFSGIPTVHSQKSWFFPFSFERKEDDIEALWQLARLAMKRPIAEINEELFERCCQVKMVGIGKLTSGLFWINPQRFLPCDKKTIEFSKKHGIRARPLNFRSYLEWQEEISKELGSDFPKVSHDAYPEDSVKPKGPKIPRYWVYSPGQGAKHWEEFYKAGMLAIGWEEAGDLRQYADKETLREKLQELWPDSSQTNNALTCWDFANVMEVGDIVFAKQGTRKVVGYGQVTGNYRFDDKRQSYGSIRPMKWLEKGTWELLEDRHLPLNGHK